MDLEKLLSEISPDQPCGENLEYDPVFGEMERASQGKAEQVMGDSVVAAEEPDWREVKKLATGLLERTKDLRAAVYLARAAVHTDGMTGLAAGLALVEGLLDRYWEHVHPQLDPDDDNDPTLRVNVIASLCDPDTVLRNVREAPLVRSRGLGQFSLKDIQIATGQAPAAAGSDPPDATTIDAAFLDCDLEELQQTADAVSGSSELVVSIETGLTERVGTTQAADLSELGNLLKSIQVELGERLERRGVVGVSTDAAEVAPAAGGEAAAATQTLTGEVRSREDAIRALEKVCDYFVRHEPSSPVPLLLQRAKRLVSKNFMEIVRDLAPDGVSQVELFRGTDGEAED